MDDDGEYLGGTYKVNKILSDSWKFLCIEKGKKIYDERCRYELRFREQQLRSSLLVPVVLSAPKTNMSNERMVQPPPHAFRVSGGETKGKASSSTTVPYVKKGRKNNEDAPKNCLDVLKAFTKKDVKKINNLVETPKEEAVNANHDDETMKNLGMESTKETHK